MSTTLPEERRRADQRKEDAFAVHRALLLIELTNPALCDNPFWILHRMDAYEAFARLMKESAS